MQRAADFAAPDLARPIIGYREWVQVGDEVWGYVRRDYVSQGTAAELVPALDAALASGGTQLVVVRGDRAANLARHLALTAAVAAAVGG